jgi:hypothetical protein
VLINYTPEETAQHEKAVMASFEVEERWLVARIRSFWAPGWTAAKLAADLEELAGHIIRLSQYGSIASELARKGYPTFQTKLDALRQHAESEKSKLTEGFLRKCALENFIPAPLPPPLNFRAIFEQGARNWQSIQNRTCVNCGHWLGDQYYRVDVCPACRTYARPS